MIALGREEVLGAVAREEGKGGLGINRAEHGW